MLSTIHTTNDGSFVSEKSSFVLESGHLNVNLVAFCPLTYAPPFMPPFKRGLNPEDERRLMSWLAELLPGEPVSMVEWVGTDLRQPLHAVVLSFRSNNRAPIVLVHKVEELERRHIVQAIEGNSQI